MGDRGASAYPLKRKSPAGTEPERLRNGLTPVRSAAGRGAWRMHAAWTAVVAAARERDSSMAISPPERTAGCEILVAVLSYLAMNERIATL